ncbi:hypothetical protein Scep_004589 [Stephania cephalantha]|uniref:Uncharacterized protein n=1 Tax=Stephania cephalantha TaxID=152367 RepID=A0AAP0KTM9_9MAGN
MNEKEKEKGELGFERGMGSEGDSLDSRDMALRDKEVEEKEVKSLRYVVRMRKGVELQQICLRELVRLIGNDPEVVAEGNGVHATSFILFLEKGGGNAIALRRFAPKDLLSNIILVWNFSLQRVKSKKIAESIRRNILIHGSSDGAGEDGGTEMALRNRDGRKKEVVNLRNVVLRQQNELRAKVLELSIEEAERKRMLD